MSPLLMERDMAKNVVRGYQMPKPQSACSAGGVEGEPSNTVSGAVNVYSKYS